MDKKLVQYVQEINHDMKEAGVKEIDRCAFLVKIASIVLCSARCGKEQIYEATDYIDKCVLESDEVPEEHKAMIMLASVIRSL